MLLDDHISLSEETRKTKKKRNLRLLARQGWECSICRTPLSGGKDTCWDHNHKTGAFRAMLCSHCNLGLGHFKDNILNLRKAALYLELHE